MNHPLDDWQQECDRWARECFWIRAMWALMMAFWITMIASTLLAASTGISLFGLLWLIPFVPWLLVMRHVHRLQKDDG